MGDIEKKKDRRLWHRGGRQPQGYRPGPFAAIYSGLLAAGLAAAAAVYYVLVHHVPGMAKDPADTVKTALLVIGGSGALAGLYVSYRKQRTDEANHVRDQDKLFTERYTQAAAQLGSTAAAVRLAGVYALARIADDSERDRPTCLKVLCAYLRMPHDPDKAEPAEREVRTTAQTAIAERLRPAHPGFWSYAQIDLTGAHLIDARFDRIAVDTFTAVKATLSGTARFDGATFNGPARFDRANFSGPATFGEVTFSGNAGFGEATFSEAASFDKATFKGNALFGDATFSDGARFGEATFSKAAWFRGATFSGNARFLVATFSGQAGFDGATFNGNARFGGVTFSRTASFGEARFSGNASFGEATFSGTAWFSEATFSGTASFSEAAFSGDASFGRATFSGDASFGEARFSKDASFGEATFSRAYPPAWPDGFTEPSGIVWDPADPPTPAPDPDPPADPANPPTAP